jgi:hypothetical protein
MSHGLVQSTIIHHAAGTWSCRIHRTSHSRAGTIQVIWCLPIFQWSKIENKDREMYSSSVYRVCKSIPYGFKLLHKILLGWSNEGGVRWAGHVACIEDMRNSYKILVT